MYELDGYDERILRILCDDARQSYRDIAGSVKRSKDAVRNRVKSYEEHGVFNDFIARINQSPFVDGVLCVMVKTSEPRRCIDMITNNPCVNWASTLIGDYDIAFTYCAKTVKEAKTNIRTILDKSFVASYRTHLYTKEHKFDRGQILGDPRVTNDHASSSSVDINELDRAILAELAMNARSSYADIAREQGVSGPTVSRRVKRLREQGVLLGFSISLRPYQFGYETYFIGVRSCELSAEQTRTVTGMDVVTFFTESIGYYDYFIRVTVTDQHRLQTAMNELQSVLQYPSIDLHRVVDEPKEVFVPPGVIRRDTPNQ